MFWSLQLLFDVLAKMRQNALAHIAMKTTLAPKSTALKA
jgi:hypothetical protein